MTNNRKEDMLRFIHGLTFKALNRKDNGWMYIFLEEDKSPHNLMVSDFSDAIRDTVYSISERGDKCFITFDGGEYEVILPDKIAEEEEAFHFQLKDATGNVVEFEEYI